MRVEHVEISIACSKMDIHISVKVQHLADFLNPYCFYKLLLIGFH